MLNAISLGCVSISNQEFKVRPEIVNVTSKELIFFPCSLLKQVNAVEVVIILIMPLQNCLFLMWLKILNSKFLI